MDWYFSAPIWEAQSVCPHTTKFAVPCDPKFVKNKPVIHVKGAFFRGSTFDGTFVLSERVVLPLPRSGTERVEIYCRWFGHRLKTRGFLFEVDMTKAKVEENYSGSVSSDFTKRSSTR